MSYSGTKFLPLLLLALINLSLGDKVVCPGQVCKGTYGEGCCVKIGLQCCPDGLYCVKNATTMCGAEGSPPKPYGSAAPVNNLSTGRKLLSLKGTTCPNGICELDNAFCCEDGLYCAETENGCPNFLKSAKKLSDNKFGRKLLSLKSTTCPNGICELEDAFCCDDGLYCAATEAGCPNFLSKARKLFN